MNLPILRKPNKIWNKPPSMTTVKARAAPRAGSSGNMAVYWVKMAAMTTVMGPVGPET